MTTFALLYSLFPPEAGVDEDEEVLFSEGDAVGLLPFPSLELDAAGFLALLPA